MELFYEVKRFLILFLPAIINKLPECDMTRYLKPWEINCSYSDEVH
ncbi:Uncharacterised protein [uncultured archaeon]|nr:Uncharacterised protein [uncultured archaeon]